MGQGRACAAHLPWTGRSLQDASKVRVRELACAGQGVSTMVQDGGRRALCSRVCPSRQRVGRRCRALRRASAMLRLAWHRRADRRAAGGRGGRALPGRASGRVRPLRALLTVCVGGMREACLATALASQPNTSGPSDGQRLSRASLTVLAARGEVTAGVCGCGGEGGRG
jgi:hypothetical protein